MVPRTHRDRMLVFVEAKIRPRASYVVILEVVAGMIVFVFEEQYCGILRGDLLLNGGVPFNAVEIVVRPNAVVVVVFEIERITGAAESAKLRGQFRKHFVCARR